jgi:V-type H+-transporting ATPase subunit a
MLFDGRYVLVVMSLYAIFCGFIYNECFSVPLTIFGSAWRIPYEGFNWTNPDLANYTYIPIHGQVYPFGVDPVWKGSPNELDFYNSFKMKLSILLGVLQVLPLIFLFLFSFLSFFLFFLSAFSYFLLILFILLLQRCP